MMRYLFEKGAEMNDYKGSLDAFGKLGKSPDESYLAFVQRITNDLENHKRWMEAIEQTCREAGKTEFGVNVFIGKLADQLRDQNTRLDDITDACTILGMEVGGEVVEFLTAIADSDTAPTFSDCIFNTYIA